MISETRDPRIQLELPEALNHARSSYENAVMAALKDVADFFISSELELPSTNLIDSATVFENSLKAREHLAKAYDTQIENILETLSGTVEGHSLFLVSRETYREIWRKMYPAWAWTEHTYHQLVVHELAHRAHEELAIASYGSADAMGPTWFFEGLAVTCAGQFETDSQMMGCEELQEQVGSERTPEVSYPLYGHIVRSLADKYGMKVLVTRASEPGFPQFLWASPT